MRHHSFLGIVISCAIGVASLNAQHNYGGEPGHLPFAHDHSGGCGGPSGGVCYGYAMGTLGGSICNPATMIPPNTCNNDSAWSSWSVNSYYFEYHSDPKLDTSSPIIINFGSNHVAYASSGASGAPASIAISHIRTTGEPPTNGTAYKQASGCYNWTESGYGSYNSQGYWTLKNVNVTGQNRFYNGSNPVTNQGTVNLGGYSGTSPLTRALNWTQPQTATATDLQDYPTGYKQVFDNSWTQGGADRGSTLQISISVISGAQAYQANFHEAAPITLTAAGGGGGITVDGQTWYSSHIKYGKINPPPADQVSPTAIPTTANYIDYVFACWTNSGNSDTAYTSNISFYASVPVTYTAHFTAKPQPPTNLDQVASVGQHVHLTWVDNPNSNVSTYRIYRHQVGQQRSLVATVNRGVQSWIDPYVLVAAPKEGPEYLYDVCSIYDDVESDYATVSTFGEEIKIGAIGNGMFYELENESGVPTAYSVSSYPNPFNPSTTLSYRLPQDAAVSLQIYDLIGREVKSLVDDSKSAGYYRVVWNGRDQMGKEVASGVYLYRFSATPTDGGKTVVRSGKLVVTR